MTGLHAIVASDLRPVISTAALSPEIAKDLRDCEYTYRRMAFMSPDRGRTVRPFESVIDDIRTQLSMLVCVGDAALALEFQQRLLESRLIMVGVYRLLANSAASRPELDSILAVLALSIENLPAPILDCEKLLEQTHLEMTLLVNLIEVQVAIQSMQFVNCIVSLYEAKTELTRAKKHPSLRGFSSVTWFQTFFSTLFARVNVYFHDILKRSYRSPPPLANLLKKCDINLISQIGSGITKAGAACACLIYNGSELSSPPTMISGYQFPEDASTVSGLGFWPCVYSFSCTAGFNLQMHMANIVSLLMDHSSPLRLFGGPVVHRDNSSGISYVFIQVDVRMFLVIIASNPQSNQAAAQLVQTANSLARPFRDIPPPSPY
uniref:Uncharacterized protein n=1 Tax=Spongospora subterranea TaxID=70186 RepID=A0A0H5R688_9EUKA|eukprot:CRZ09665.1 hypothetical protein [Spongospora subterranea]